jgi:molybdate transport system substrate-binding protein
MTRDRLRRAFLLACALVAALPATGWCATVRVAVAANFEPVVRALEPSFTAHTGHTLAITSGATGKLATQIEQGAPFDVLLAADAERPRRLEEQGIAVRGSRFTYARGRLVLWSPQAGQHLGPETLRAARFAHLAVADPVAAPYGAAAVDVLTHLGLYHALQPKLVRGESIGQTYAFVASGAAELGFVALSQVAEQARGSRWEVPETLHEPIDQQAVLLANTDEPVAARAFLEMLRSPEARAVIRRFGYGLP